MRTVTVCVCTFKRPVLLRRLLNALDMLETGRELVYSVVVVDNDSAESAEGTVREFAATASFSVTYCVEPRQNIALARNKALESGTGEFVAFIDDDEFPNRTWLRELLKTHDQYKVAGVLGPVRPWFDHEPPAWILKGRFFDRPEHPTGYRLGMWQVRTGNVLFERRILEGVTTPFRSEFGTAGEDVDFFRRMMEGGHAFVWCNEAPVFEVIPPERCTRKYLLKKSFLRASNFLKHPTDRVANIMKSCVAVPAYAVALPFLLIAGQHHFMKHLIKFCDHGGRLLTLIGINPVRERDH